VEAAMPEQSKEASTNIRSDDAQRIQGEAQPLAPPAVKKHPRVRVKNVQQFLLSLLVLGFLGFLLVKLWELFSTVQKEVAAAIIAGLFAVTVNVVVKLLERKRAIEQEIRSKKIPVYEEFLAFMFKFMKAKKLGTPMSDEEQIAFFFGFNEKMIIWGSSEVIRAWSRFRVSVGEKSHDMLFDMEQVLRAIRRDTGHGDETLKKGDLLMLFVNDLKQPED
jgi:hypothetical protein